MNQTKEWLLEIQTSLAQSRKDGREIIEGLKIIVNLKRKDTVARRGGVFLT